MKHDDFRANDKLLKSFKKNHKKMLRLLKNQVIQRKRLDRIEKNLNISST